LYRTQYKPYSEHRATEYMVVCMALVLQAYGSMLSSCLVWRTHFMSATSRLWTYDRKFEYML